MNNILNKKDIIQQWHHEKSLNTGKPKEVIHSTATTELLKATPLTAKRQSTFIKLADESPLRGTESEDADYDSFNEQETDICRSSCDELSNDDYITDEVVEVEEYELDDTSSSEILYSDNGSTSGTDDLIVAAVVAQSIFNAVSSDSDQFEIFAADADTEESDAPTDPELGRADYWTCIKCKNQKNNPMYRFCEKCYQIRKTHFPPRPKHRKKRRTKTKSSMSASTKSPSSFRHLSSSPLSHKLNGRLSQNSNNSDGSDDIGNLLGTNMAKQKSTMHRRKNAAQHHSAGDSSCCSSQEMSPDEQQLTYQRSNSSCNKKYMKVSSSNSPTYCSKIDHCVDNQIPKKLSILESNYPNSQDSGYINSQEYSSQTSTFSGTSRTAVMGVRAIPASTSSLSLSSSSMDTDRRNLLAIDNDDNDNHRLDNVGHAVQVAPTSSLLSQASTLSSIDSQDALKLNDSDGIDSNSSDKRLNNSRKRKTNAYDVNELCCNDSDASDADDEPIRKQLKTTTTAFDHCDGSPYGMCSICLTKPKNAAFVHNRIIHIYACYSCSVKVWNKRKRCPICNSQVRMVSNVFVH